MLAVLKGPQVMTENKATMQRLLNVAMTSWALPSLARSDFHKGRCWVCLHETFKRMAIEHPEWMAKTNRLNRRYKNQAEQFLLDNTPIVTCMFKDIPILLDEDENIWESQRNATCKRHLQEMMDAMPE
jgi:hypothetical protein